MNKFKAWLIRKLGGYVYLEEKVIYKTLPCITTNVDIVLPSPEWDTVISESEKIKIANREAADKIGRYIIENGYMKVNLYDVDGKCKKKYVHRLVAIAFIPNPNNYSEVNHIDCDKTNNHVDNLEWCSRKTNLKHSYEHGLKRCGEKHGCHKITWDAVHDIRTRELSQKEYGSKYGIAQCTVSAIQLGRIWKEGDL